MHVLLVGGFLKLNFNLLIWSTSFLSNEILDSFYQADFVIQTGWSHDRRVDLWVLLSDGDTETSSLDRPIFVLLFELDLLNYGSSWVL